MSKKDETFLQKLQAAFKVEATEHVKALSSGLMALEKAATAITRAEVVEAAFREVHTLKGAARAVGARETEAVCQSLESVFSALKREVIEASPELLDLLHETVDMLDAQVRMAVTGKVAAAAPSLGNLVSRLGAVVKDVPPQDVGAALAAADVDSRLAPALGELKPLLQPELEKKTVPEDTVRTSVAKLDSLLLQIEELLSAKLATGQRVAELRQLGASLAAWSKGRAKIDPEVRAIRKSLERETKSNGVVRGGSHARKVLEFLDWEHGFAKSLDARLTALTKASDRDRRSLAAMVDGLLEDAKTVLMFPSSSALDVFPKLVRDLSRHQDKDVDLLIGGAEIEIDRRVLEEIKDPLIHLVRNCIDHGVEMPEERERNHKPRRGSIRIEITQQEGGRVEITVADDGRGIDVAGVREVAQRLGMVSREEAEALGEPGVLPLIFRSGVSTSPIITTISGRGLGLAIVREKVEKLGGTVSVETHAGAGTTFRIVLPVTLAAFRGVLVRVDGHVFVLPTTYVQRVARVGHDEIKTVENRETVRLDGETLSLVRLGEVLELPRAAVPVGATKGAHVTVLASAGQRMAFLVDEILEEQEVLVKPLGKPLARVRNVAGATVLGTGRAVPILDVPDLMKSAVQHAAFQVRGALPTEPAPAQAKAIMVAEDSITTRMLLKSILESAGYTVTTAVDGLDAYTQLKSGTFDLVVSDVEMPRMDGFDLTARIRSDKGLSELPVVLVTALELREHRERGIDVGANAYIVKSSFDQSNLLEVVRRLV